MADSRRGPRARGARAKARRPSSFLPDTRQATWRTPVERTALLGTRVTWAGVSAARRSASRAAWKRAWTREPTRRRLLGSERWRWTSRARISALSSGETQVMAAATSGSGPRSSEESSTVWPTRSQWARASGTWTTTMKVRASTRRRSGVSAITSWPTVGSLAAAMPSPSRPRTTRPANGVVMVTVSVGAAPARTAAARGARFQRVKRSVRARIEGGSASLTAAASSPWAAKTSGL